MSTEHQQFSTENQLDLIRQYAGLHGLEIVKIYSDDGRSGLNIEGRAALAQMIADVTNGVADYGHILVYDVTRWGRFQDAGESAHYEDLCQCGGVAVHFCAEDFKSDGSMSSTLYKSIKRVFAGDNTYPRTSFKLKRKHVANPREKWIRAEGVFLPLVDRMMFDVIQRMILCRSRKFSDDEMLEKLRAVLAKHGRITGLPIDEEDEAPSSSAFRNRFGRLVRADQLIGYSPEIDFAFIEANRRLRERRANVITEVVGRHRELGATVSQAEDTRASSFEK